MMWTAVVPLKHWSERKTRLAGRFSPDDRRSLSDAIAAHVFATLARIDQIGRILCLSPVPVFVNRAEWQPDEGRGLNAELEVIRRSCLGSMLVIHADLPLLGERDVEALLDAAAGVGALAPDRCHTGTNAVALLACQSFAFAFGADSYRAHRRALPEGVIVERIGLALDVDTPGDLGDAIKLGFAWAVPGNHEQSRCAA